MTPETKEAVELLLSSRQFIYSLMHKVIGREPDQEMLDILLNDQTSQVLSLFSTEDGDVLSKAPLFLDEVKSDLRSDAEFVDKVKTEYMHLFIGPLKLIAPPWESVYFGEDAMLFQASTLKVREFYRSFGLIPEGYPHVPDDSLALELDFMSELAGRALTAFSSDDTEAVRKNLQGSSDFLKAHLLVWYPRFLKKMKDTPTDYLYPQICLILDSILKKDEEMLSQILELL